MILKLAFGLKHLESGREAVTFLPAVSLFLQGYSGKKSMTSSQVNSDPLCISVSNLIFLTKNPICSIIFSFKTSIFYSVEALSDVTWKGLIQVNSHGMLSRVTKPH